jgi:hypothetical protein
MDNTENKTVEISEAELEVLISIQDKYNSLIGAVGSVDDLKAKITADLDDYDKVKLSQIDVLIKRQAESTTLADKLDISKQISKIAELPKPSVESVLKNYKRLILVDDRLYEAPVLYTSATTTNTSVGSTGKRVSKANTGDIVRLVTDSIISEEMTVASDGKVILSDGTAIKPSMAVFDHKAEVAGMSHAEYLEGHNYRGRENEPGFSYKAWQIKSGDAWHSLN